jgi:hypothetical protein
MHDEFAKRLANDQSVGDAGHNPNLPHESTAMHSGLILIIAQFALIVAAVKIADIETSAFHRLMVIAWIGFIIHHYLAPRWRLRFFVLLSISTIFLIMGGGPGGGIHFAEAAIRTGAILLIGSILIGICHLPFSIWVRAALLVTAGILIASVRINIWGSSSLSVVTPILAAMFMLRLFVYLYDLSKAKQRPALSESLAYFFLLPNICFTLFPVIDFKTFCRSQDNMTRLPLYQRGIQWMMRGVVQLLLYRLISQLFLVHAESVASGTDFIRFIAGTTFLYVKVSGQFHLVIGLLLLFGFNLPETNHRYFLASSFTDYWRRVNIYWKDFIMKVFFYPAFFRLKRYGAILAMVLATLFSFIVTWVLHLYQTWWLKGIVQVTLPDVLFWLILALLVLANSLWEAKRGRQRKLATTGYSRVEIILLSLRTAGVFSIISILWSLWSCSSLRLWLSVWQFADLHSLKWGIAILMLIMAAVYFFEVLPAQRRTATGSVTAEPARGRLFQANTLQCVVLILAILLHQPNFQALVVTAPVQPTCDALVAGDSIGLNALSGRPGYYERLMNVTEADLKLWEILSNHKIDPGYQGPEPLRPVHDFRLVEMLPNVGMQAYDTYIETNAWGMRDSDYTMAKPRETLRIALLGSSHVMGWGVRKEERFDLILENRLNETFPAKALHARVEILNFAVSAYGPISQTCVMQNKVSKFHPDIVLLVTHLIDFVRTGSKLCQIAQKGMAVPPELQEILLQARIVKNTPSAIGRKRIEPFEPALVAWSFRKIAEECRAIGAKPVCIFMPLAYEITDEAPFSSNKKVALLLSLARNAGFDLIDLSNMYNQQDPRTLILDEPWKHSNTSAHRLIADVLFKQLTTDPHIDLASQLRKAVAMNDAITQSGLTRILNNEQSKRN